MNNLPRQTLRRIIDKHGKEIGDDPKRCESLLNDFCGSYRREINVLVNAIEERVPLDLLNGVGSMPLELLLTRLEKRFAEQTAITAEAASWAIESWALALKAATDAEIEARAARRAKSSVPPSDAETTQPKRSADSSAQPNISRPNPIQPPKPVQPPKMPVNLPPLPRSNPPMRPPKNSPVNSSVNFPANVPANLPVNNQTINPPVQTPTINRTPAMRRGFGLIRGCLLVVVLLIVSSIALFFAVPYAIERMRETQRERNSEPPRFPVR